MPNEPTPNASPAGGPAARTALVTGAGGFIGRRVVRHLAARGWGVRALLLPDEPAPAAWGGGVDVVRGDVADGAAVARAAVGTTAIVHLAALVGDWNTWADHARVTVGGTRSVLDAAAAGGQRVVLASSICVYGDRIPRQACPEDTPFGRPTSNYERAKQEQERLADAYARTRGVRVAVVRPSNVTGAGSGPWVTSTVAALRSGHPTLVGDGSGNAGLVWVENLAELFALAAERDEAVGRAFNACDGWDVSWRRYFTDLAAIAGAPPPTTVNPTVARAAAVVYENVWRLLGRTERPPTTRGALNLVGADSRIPSDRARRELGWAPRGTYGDAIAEIRASLAG